MTPDSSGASASPISETRTPPVPTGSELEATEAALMYLGSALRTSGPDRAVDVSGSALRTSGPDRALDVSGSALRTSGPDRAVADTALVTVIDTWGSAPVPIGGQMAVAQDGRFAGSVSGGCIEADIMVAASKAMADGKHRVMSFGVTDETAWRAGLPCGGNIRVLIEPLTAATDRAVLERLAAAARTRETLIAVTDLGTGARRIVERDGIAAIVATVLDKQPDAPDVRDLAHRLAGGDSRLVATPDGEVFCRTFAPPAQLVIIGATHIAQALVALAHIAGYRAIVVDPREAYATQDRFMGDRFGGVDIVADSPAEALERIGIDAFTAVIALAHVIHIDDEALKAALRGNARYIGVLGSRRNRDRRRDRLCAEGFSDAEIERIRSPIGLDIGALTPAEIAVAILAEVIETVRGKRRPDL
ncbi:MAG: XdhC family protein [Hyphomicrobium aestuarii]|nr:XdhC family protein [Hyphomicrobium aestuarii]